MTFERILVPTDFSENAGWALERAVRLAQAFGGRLELVHAYQVPRSYDVALPDTLVRAVRDEGARRLLKVLEGVWAQDVEAEMHLVEEALPEAVAQLASDLDIDCVVMGTRGLTGIKHVLLGSNAERTLRAVPCPVLTVGQPAPPGTSERPERFLVPIDFSSTSLRGLQLARELTSGRAGGHVTLLHAYSIPAGVHSYMEINAFPGFERLPLHLLEELEEVARPLRKEGLSTSVRLLEGHAASCITEIAREEGADWIVMGTHGRTGLPHAILGSVAERVVRSAPCPTLTVKD